MESYQSVETVVHLLGEQPIPMFLGAMQFENCKKHILLITKKTNKTANSVKKELELYGKNVEIYMLGDDSIAYDIPRLTKKYCDLLDHLDNSENTAVNATGGTKIMFAVLLGILNRNYPKIRYFYMETSQKKLFWLDSKQAVALKPMMKVENFIRLAGFHIRNYNSITSEIEARKNFVYCCWEEQMKLQQMQGEFSKKIKNCSNEEHCNLVSKLKKKAPKLRSKFDSCNITNKTKLREFLAGKWLEEYVYLKFKEANNLNIKELYINYELTLRDQTAQEFDVCYTDGYKLVIVECKAGLVKQESINKLNDISSKFAGVLGGSALFFIGSMSDHDIERIKTARSMSAFRGNSGLSILINECLSFRNGNIFPETSAN